MQPIVITIQKDDEGYIKLTEEQLRDYIQKAYEAGYNERWNYYTAPCTTPYGSHSNQIYTIDPSDPRVTVTYSNESEDK